MIEEMQALEQLLDGLGEAARFESVGQVPAVLPGLEVHGIGSIGVPVAPADAKRIIGKGSPQTLVCTKTQNSYERSRKQYEVDQVVLA